MDEQAPEAQDTRDLRRALGCFATGVAVITTRHRDGRPAGLTINSFTSVSLHPPLVLWSLSLAAFSLPAFHDAEHFAVNLLAADQLELSRRFAAPAIDRFAGVGFAEGLGGAPLLDGAVASFECRTENRYDGGDHVIFLGRVERYRYGEAEPLVFARGRFGTLCEMDE
jgi:flavin reductase (DIM6/NTAB) family NADH-FMN oxidoreductase RutF